MTLDEILNRDNRDDYCVTTTYLRDETIRDRLNGLQGTLTPVDININENTSAYMEVVWINEEEL